LLHVANSQCLQARSWLDRQSLYSFVRTQYFKVIVLRWQLIKFRT
jgi:hypothetical protein